MKYPKAFNKWSLQEQEDWLVKKHIEKEKEYLDVKRALATVRGGFKYVAQEIDRPDLLEMRPDLQESKY
jgi:hypothetical protein